MRQLENIEKAALVFAFIVVAGALLKHASEWKQVVSAEGAFSILMPKNPKLENASMTINGVNVESHSFLASNQEGNFTVLYMDAPVIPTGASMEKVFDLQRSSLTEGDETRMLSSETLTVNGYPGRQFKARTEDDEIADEQLCLIKRRLYVLLVVHDKDRAEDDVKKFFASFKFEPRD